MSAYEAFSYAIAYIKDRILHDISKEKADLTNKDVLYLLLVPAMATNAAKQFMREAATAEQVGIRDDQLHLVLETEAASVYCRHTFSHGERQRDGKLQLMKFPAGYTYATVNLGGGSTEITTHKIKKSDLQEEACPVGEMIGGQSFTRRGLDFIASLVGTEIFQTWRSVKTGDFIELQKTISGLQWDVTDKDDEEILLEIPQSLSDMVQEMSKQSIETVIQQSSQNQSVEVCGRGKVLIKMVVVREFFNDILKTVEKELADLRKDLKIQTIFLVGGLANSVCIQEHIKTQFPQVSLVVPEDPGIASLKGAVLLGNRPDIIAGRIARFSYGIGIATDFDKTRHAHKFKFYRNGKMKCDHVFQRLIKKGTMIKYGHIITLKTRAHASEPDKKRTPIPTYIYRSTLESPVHTVDECCCRLGRFYEAPPARGWPDSWESKVEITLAGGAEFKVFVSDDTGRTYEAMLDFL